MTHLTVAEHESVTVTMSAACARALSSHPLAGLTVTPGGHDGDWNVRASSRVGVVTAGDVTLAIRPKIPIESALALMVDTPASEQWLDDDSDLAPSTDLLRLVVHAFARELDRAIARGVCRDYVEERDELVGVRGRIDIGQLARRPRAAVALPCVFDEFTADTGLNRLLLAAVLRSAQVPLSAGFDRTLLRRCEAALDGVGRATDPLAWYDAWVPTRRDVHFVRAARLAALILRHLTISDLAGGVPTQAFVVDMNALVESFIEVRLRAALDGVLQVRGQAGTYLDEERTVPMIPDLRLQKHGRDLLVADVKYKVVGSLEQAANTDIYQAAAYASSMGLSDAVLITCGPEHEGAKRVTVRQSGIRLHLHSLQLAGGNAELRREVDLLANHLAEIAFSGGSGG